MASTYQTVSYGSTGSAVRKLQTALNKKGYTLDVDGIFGDKTRAAVRDYQKKNKLLLDGIAGNETWSHLMQSVTKPTKATTGKQVLSGVSDETADALRRLEKGYAPSDDVRAAQAVWQSTESTRPGAYQSPYARQMAALYKEIQNRPDFAYDPAQDALYQRYAALYTRQGQQAMADTMGEAAALTGGYGSSYAQSAGQQAYGAYLQELNDLLPELAANAREQYDAQGEALLAQYGLLEDREQQAYGRWQDKMDVWQEDRDAARDAYTALQKQDYDAYETLLGHYLSKAKTEQSASDGKQANTGKTAAAKKSSLSSTASESLQRAMKNYLASGNSAAALRLASQYKGRMTAGQKKTFTKLFSKYGKTVKL
ncbi:MAG: peptidoglycan-binding protein [Clostridiales bacterium]|nr:peptidoglycan-binding protein [Candidatus Cacconaster stercorequi]